MLATDIHCHLLPGYDHGSRNRSETLIMARGLVERGVGTVHATPHQYRWGIDLGAAEIRAATEEVQGWMEQTGLPLRLVPGAEYFYGERLYDAVDRGEELMTWRGPSAETPRAFVLVELPARDPVVGVSRFPERLGEVGITPVMAHPERIASVQTDATRAIRWKEAGWSLQLDLLSLAGGYGRAARRIARWLLTEGHYAFAGSDLHRPAQLRTLSKAHAEFRALSPQEADA